MPDFMQQKDGPIELPELFKYMEQELYIEWMNWECYGWPPERAAFEKAAREMLRHAEQNGNTLTFCAPDGREPAKEMQAYNYLLLWSQGLADEEENDEYDCEDAAPHQLRGNCVIEGFDSFAALSERITGDSTGMLFYVYVKTYLTDHRYEKAFCRLSFQKPGRPPCYTTVREFYRMKQDVDARFQDIQYRLEIVGLCEFHSDGGIFTTLVDSMDGIAQLFLLIVYAWYNKYSSLYRQTGTFLYENTEYRYDLKGEEFCTLRIEDNDRYYCDFRHSFVPKCALKQVERNCDLCELFFYGS